MASIFDTITPAWLKNKFLLGIDLTLDDGSDYPDEIYTQSLAAAVSFMEHELGISINNRVVATERHDALEKHRAGWWPFRLDHRPVLKMTGAQLRYGNYSPVALPDTWLQLISPQHGQVHLIPSQESLGSFTFTSGVPLITGDVFFHADYIPGYFQFAYEAGFGFDDGTESFSSEATKSVTLKYPQDNADYSVVATVDDNAGNGVGLLVKNKTNTGFDLTWTTPPVGDATVSWAVNPVPADILQGIGYKAALLPLDVAGDLIAGAGVATLSTSVDSLSQSLGTTSSATNCLHADTKIALADGTTPTIASLVGVGAFQVACVDAEGISRIGSGHSARKTIEDDILAVELSSGEEVLCNAGHPFRLLNGSYVPAGQLRSGLLLTPCSLVTDAPQIEVNNVRETGERAWLYDITVDDYHCFGIGQGVVVHNSGYGARVLAFERELKALLPALRAKYKTMQMFTI